MNHHMIGAAIPPQFLEISFIIPVLIGLIGLFVESLFFVNKIPLSYNLRNLQVRWMTTALTAAAFVLVIGLLTWMLAFINGMMMLTSNSGQPSNVIVLSEGSTDETFSDLGFGDAGDIENQPGVLRENGVAVASRETYLVVNQMLPESPPGRPKRRFMQLRGIEDAPMAGRVHGIPLYDNESGAAWFSQAGVRELATSDKGKGEAGNAIEAVLGEGLARELCQNPDGQELGNKTKPRLVAGDTFELNERTWLVTGVLKSSGSTFDTELWAKRSLVSAMFGKESISTLVLRAESPKQATVLAKYLSNDYKKKAVAAMTEPEYFSRLSDTSKQFSYAFGFVILILSCGGVFGVMNTMFAAISQRAKDIEVMRLLGFGRGQILTSFMLESLIIAMLGGILGCVIGTLLFHGRTATSIIGSGAGPGRSIVLKFTVDSTVIAIELLLTFFMGFFGGLIPSMNAMGFRRKRS